MEYLIAQKWVSAIESEYAIQYRCLEVRECKAVIYGQLSDIPDNRSSTREVILVLPHFDCHEGRR
jgi:hypothetical protein